MQTAIKILCILCFIVAIYSGIQFTTCINYMAKLRDIDEASHSLLIALLDAETGQRGYIITGDDLYLDPYQAGIEAAPRKLNDLITISDHTPQTATVANLAQVTHQKLTELAETIQLRRNGNFSASAHEVDNHLGKNLMDTIRLRLDSIQFWSNEQYQATKDTGQLYAEIGFTTMLMWWISATLLLVRRT